MHHLETSVVEEASIHGHDRKTVSQDHSEFYLSKIRSLNGASSVIELR